MKCRNLLKSLGLAAASLAFWRSKIPSRVELEKLPCVIVSELSLNLDKSQGKRRVY